MNLPDCLPRTALVLSYVYGVENYTLVDKQILFHFEMELIPFGLSGQQNLQFKK